MPSDAPFHRDAFAELTITTTASFAAVSGWGYGRRQEDFISVNTVIDNRYLKKRKADAG